MTLHSNKPYVLTLLGLLVGATFTTIVVTNKDTISIEEFQEFSATQKALQENVTKTITREEIEIIVKNLQEDTLTPEEASQKLAQETVANMEPIFTELQNVRGMVQHLELQLQEILKVDDSGEPVEVATIDMVNNVVFQLEEFGFNIAQQLDEETGKEKDNVEDTKDTVIETKDQLKDTNEDLAELELQQALSEAKQESLFESIMLIGRNLTPPAGWQLCDGTNGTIDMQGMVAKGWDSSRPPGTFEDDQNKIHNHNVGGGIGEHGLARTAINGENVTPVITDHTGIGELDLLATVTGIPTDGGDENLVDSISVTFYCFIN